MTTASKIDRIAYEKETSNAGNYDQLAALIASRYPGETRIAELFQSFMGVKAYDPAFLSRLIAASRSSDASWNLRGVAVLMMEGQALAMWECVGFGEASVGLLSELGLLVNGRIRESVLREGYSTTEPHAFAVELQTRMMRLTRIHSAMNGWSTRPKAFADFLHVAAIASKLTLARYVFDPVEVAQRILGAVRVTQGLAPSGSGDSPWQASQLTSVFDEALVHTLRRGRKVLWVSPDTSSELNSLVEYPLGTVALVIKPPGSDVEFEVKRAGMRGAYPLDVLYDRAGTPVPVHHRMQGASSGAMLEFETYASRRFSTIYRETHGADPPMSRMLGYTAISSVPFGPGSAHVLDYLGRREVFGPQFDCMRQHLKQCVQSYEGANPRQDLPGEVGWTMRFFNHTVPNQAWIEGTTSFRLDRLVKLLSPEGPASYFRDGLGRDFTDDDARRLADEVLEEVLGVISPPSVFVNYDKYVETTLAMPVNRALADEAYLDAVKQTGIYWGTMLAVGGFTEGESFVTRNVGLKSRWMGGRWRARICFMDHDNILALGGGDVPHPVRTVESVRLDEMWICGDRERCLMTCLAKIYRISPALQQQGDELLRTSIAEAFRTTRSAMLHAEPVRRMFDAEYVRSTQTREEVIRLYLANRASKASRKRWRKASLQMMSGTLYRQECIAEFLDIVERNEPMFLNYSFLLDTVS